MGHWSENYNCNYILYLQTKLAFVMYEHLIRNSKTGINNF